MGKIIENAGKVRLVLDDQNATIAERRPFTVVGKCWRAAHNRCDIERRLRFGLGQCGNRLIDDHRRHLLNDRLIALRQDQAEYTAFASAAVDTDLATEQACQIARDRQAQAGAAITPIGGAIGLVEGFEDTLLLVGGDANAAVAHREDHTGARLIADRQANLPVLGEFHGIGQQVLENLLQALAVGVQGCRNLWLNAHAKAQLLVAGQRLEQALQAFGQTCYMGGFRAHFEFAGLDLGDVEYVVDQVEQVIACRIDRLGKLDLLLAEVVLRVLRQQLGEDQRTVERRAQLVGHIGEELGLVLARALQLFGARLQFELRLVQFTVLAVQCIALVGQGIGTFGQLLVGLFEFGLLSLKVRLRLFEHPRLLFELFVGGFQLFLLYLQLFVELLGFGQHFLQALAVTRTFNGGAEVVSDQFQQLDIAVGQGSQETQFDHPVDLPIVTGRHHQHTARQPFTEPGTDFEVVLGHLIKTQQTPLAQGLAKYAFVRTDHLFTGFLITGEAVAGHAAQTTMFVTHVQRCNYAAQIGSEEAQDIVTQHWQRQLAEHLFGQLCLAATQPGLLFEALGRALLSLQVTGVTR
ncbi:hypothetical protein D3C77_329770 [compost metagenome]